MSDVVEGNGIPAVVPHVYTAIAAVKRRIAAEGIAKDGKNQQQGYTFRSIDNVYNALAPILADEGLCIIPRVTERTVNERETKSGTVLYSVVVRVEYSLVSAKDGSQDLVVMYGEAMDSGDKATNKAMSAAHKYCCIETFCIPTKGEKDADADTPEETKSKTKARQQAVAERKIAEIKAGTYQPDPDPRLEQKLVASIGQAEAKKTGTSKNFKMLQHFRELRGQFKKLNAEPMYYAILGAHGVEHSNEFPDTPSGHQSALDCAKEMKLRLKDIEAEDVQKREAIEYARH